MINEPIAQEIIYEVINNEEDSMDIVECLVKGKVTDEEIAEKTELRLNIVRRILYKLYDAGLATYKRSKDPETQWYTYTWKFEENRIKEMIHKKYQDILNNLKSVLDYEENNMFFECENDELRYTFDEATEVGFICPKCENEIIFKDNSEIINQLKDEIKVYEDIEIVGSNN